MSCCSCRKRREENCQKEKRREFSPLAHIASVSAATKQLFKLFKLKFDPPSFLGRKTPPLSFAREREGGKEKTTTITALPSPLQSRSHLLEKKKSTFTAPVSGEAGGGGGSCLVTYLAKSVVAGEWRGESKLFS